MRIITVLLASAIGVAAGEAEIFAAESSWETVSEGHRIVEGIAWAKDKLFLTDVPDRELFRIPSGRGQELMDADTGAANGLAVGPDGRLYGACMHRPAIAVWDLETGARSDIALPTPANDLAITTDGGVYYTWGAANAVYRFSLCNPKPVKAADLPNPNGITLSHDGRELWVGEFHGDTVRAFPILDDGQLGASRAAFKAKVPDNGRGLLDGMTPISDGRLLVATALGLQILAKNGEPIVLPNPTAHRANYVRILRMADGRRWIYAAHEKSVLRRKSRL
jgi:sugar lactone lactonase YvrE